MAEGISIDPHAKLARIGEHWAPHVIETFDDYEVKIAKIAGDFVWHSHAEADELFVVLDGRFRMDFRDRQVDLGPGDLLVVPRGVEHKPYAAAECSIMMIERRGMLNTGDAPASARTRHETPRS